MQLKEYIKSNGIRIIDFSHNVGCGQPMMSMIHNGKRRPSPDLALKIERATGGAVTRDELLFPELYSTHPQQPGQDKAA